VKAIVEAWPGKTGRLWPTPDRLPDLLAAHQEEDEIMLPWMEAAFRPQVGEMYSRFLEVEERMDSTAEVRGFHLPRGEKIQPEGGLIHGSITGCPAPR